MNELERAVKERLKEIADLYPTPSFVYFMDDAAQRIAAIRTAFGGLLGISYAMKCNPNAAILEWMRGRVDTLDISSGGELAKGIAAGWEPERISFTGPAKRPIDLQESVHHSIGEVILESVNEARELDRHAGAAGRRQRVLIRVAPRRVPRGFGVNMAGKPCQFGIDEEDLDAAIREVRALRHLHLVGFHIYSGTQCLKPDAIVENYEIFLDIFRTACDEHDIVPDKLVLGSGIGIPYHDGDQTVDINAVAAGILPTLEAFKNTDRFAQSQLLLETGRYLIGEAGYYLVRVVNRKESRGTHICVCDGGMNHHLGACGHLGMVLHRPYRIYKVASARPDTDVEPFDLYGPLCTSIDHLGRNVKLPGLDTGDVIAVACSGAYGATASPINFISHDPPAEIMVETNRGQTSVREISPATALARTHEPNLTRKAGNA